MGNSTDLLQQVLFQFDEVAKAINGRRISGIPILSHKLRATRMGPLDRCCLCPYLSREEEVFLAVTSKFFY